MNIETQRKKLNEATKKVEAHIDAIGVNMDANATINMKDWTPDMHLAFALMLDPDEVRQMMEPTTFMKNAWAIGKRLDFKIVK